MSNQMPLKSNTPMLWVIRVVSVLIPLVVALLLYIDRFYTLEVGFDTKVLPHLNAFLNSGTALMLITGFVFIKNKNIQLHRLCMMTAFVLSSFFLISYVLYHATQPSTPFGGEGLIRYFYFFILLTHIVLAAVVVPLVLLAIYYAFSNQIEKHKKMVKWTFPVWTYVAITGVLVYLMISPYYV